VRGKTTKKRYDLHLPPSTPKHLSFSGVALDAMIVKLATLSSSIFFTRKKIIREHPNVGIANAAAMANVIYKIIYCFFP
jgi:hypothetical protein